MSQRLRTWCQLMLSLMVLYLGASCLLPEEPTQLHQEAVYQKEQAPRFLHLLAEVAEELTEEDSNNVHKFPFLSEGDSLFLQQPSIPLSFPVTLSYSAQPVYKDKVQRHIRLGVLRI